MYWALILSQETKSRILRLLENAGVKIPDGWKVYCDHITVVHKKSVTTEVWNTLSSILKDYQSHSVEFRITSIAIGENVIAVEVNAGSMNKHPHITIACAPDHTPVESNQLTEWKPVLCLEKFSAKLYLK